MPLGTRGSAAEGTKDLVVDTLLSGSQWVILLDKLWKVRTFISEVYGLPFVKVYL